MTQKVAAATGLWSAAATWNSVSNTPTLHASTNITVTAGGVTSATFTAPGLTDSATGVLVYVSGVGSAGTIIATLQESGIDTAATVTLNITDLVDETWVYFRLATPYLFTTLVAGSYRWKLNTSGAGGTTTVAANSAGSAFAYLSTDDRTGVPGTTDDIWVCGHNQVTAITVTVDGTQTIGSKTDTVLAIQRTLGNAVSANNLGKVDWDTVADATLICGGNFICNNNGGELGMGTVATPMPAARVARLRFDMAASGNHGLRVFPTGKLILQGTPKSSTTLWKAKLSSGVGTAASPAIMDAAVDWSVGDEVAISATSDNATNYNETEYRFIITKNSPTSYVWSLTSGGAEAALTHAHTTNAWVLNIQRNVIIDSTDATRGYYIYDGCTVDGNVDCDWTRFDIIGASLGNKTGFLIDGSTIFASIDYSVFSRYHLALQADSVRSALTFTGLVFVTQRSGSNVATVNLTSNSHNKVLIDCYVLDSNSAGFALGTTFNVTFTRCFAIACNKTNTGTGAGFLITNSGSVAGNDCEAHAVRGRGVFLSTANSISFTNFLSGTKGVNTSTDIESNSSGVFNTVVFVNSSFGSTTLLSNYLTMLAGSSVQFHAYNGNDTNHAWYTSTGVNRSTGAGLIDTTTRTVGARALRLAAESADGVIWEFLIGISANSAASIFGFLDANAAFQADGAATCTVELFLPGSTVADESVIFPTDIPWGAAGSFDNVFNLAANYTGSVAAFARVRITARTTTSSAYVYVADLYNGTNVLTSFKAWNEGKPAPVFTELLGDAAAVWAILTSTQTTAGTMGKLVVDNLDAVVSTRATPAQVNAEVVDALNVDTYAEPGSVPAATASLVAKIGWLMALARNKILQTATLQTLRNNGDSGDIGSAVVSDDGTTATRNRWS